MKYAITFTADNSWDSTDTIIIEAPNANKAEEHLSLVLNKVLGYDEDEAGKIRRYKQYYIRNCDDVNYKVEK